MRHEIEDRLGIDALDIYGLSEVMGPGVAMECLEVKMVQRFGKITSILKLFIQKLERSYLMASWGSWFLRPLPKRECLVIRYRTRDLTRLLPGTAPTMRRMDKIVGVVMT